MKQPNILLIMSDEHNANVAGCYGNALARTPHLDALAARGVTFDGCYCNSPLCVPSRLSFTAGKYVSRVGAWSNQSDLPHAEYPSLPRVLQAAGYEALLCGKQHYARGRHYGFAEIGGHFNEGVRGGQDRRRDPDDLTPRPGFSPRFHDFHTGDDSSILRHDRRVTPAVVDFLRTRGAVDGPFFLFAGYLAPHFPLIVPEEYWRHFEGDVPPPVLPEGHLESLPRNYKHLRVGFHMTDVPAEIVRRGRELYYGLTEWLDDEIGKVLQALENSAVADDTVVVYTSDHGENLGEHGLWWKNSMYEHAARVPLVVSWPARWAGGQRRTQACSLVDLVQTLAEIAGGEVPEDWDGDSLVPWLDDAKAEWKDLAISEYYAHNIASGYAMLRQGRFKYVYHTPAGADHPAERELYDLSADPGEFSSLASRPEQQERIRQMHAALVTELGEDPDDTERRCRAEFARGGA